jgi:hypothetical protein
MRSVAGILTPRKSRQRTPASYFLAIFSVYGRITNEPRSVAGAGAA